MRRAARVAGGLLLGVAAAGVVRQALEARRVRRGRLRPAHATAAIEGPAPRGRMARLVASWTPRRPRTPAGRWLTALWAGPLTLVGMAVAALSGRWPVWEPGAGVWLAAGTGGLSAAALRAVGHSSNTIGQVVLSRRGVLPPGLLAHEAAHVRQFERLGPAMPVLYAWWALRYGYRDHPLERAARLAARQTIS